LKAEEGFGAYRRLAVARATDREVQTRGQDGGVVTALLLSGLEAKLIDGAVVSGTDQKKPFYPVPRLAETREEILECSGTRYSFSPNVRALADAAKQGKAEIAFVATACQVQAVRKMQSTSLRLATPVKYIIGLMCSECFTYEGLMEEYIRDRLGLSLLDIKKINIKGKLLVTTRSEARTIPLAEVRQYGRTCCSLCRDFSAELGDISAGGLGLDGWTFVVVRTERGGELFSEAESAGAIDVRDASEEPKALDLLCRLSRKKRTSQYGCGKKAL
jgi:coenzyme F420 hydrogenase subunit beta